MNSELPGTVFFSTNKDKDWLVRGPISEIEIDELRSERPDSR